MTDPQVAIVMLGLFILMVLFGFPHQGVRVWTGSELNQVG